MRWCLWAWLSIRWRVIPFQGSQWLWIQASKLQSSGLLITVVLILDDPHTPETLHCQLDVLGEPYHCQSFFQQKKSFQKVSSPKLHQKNANFASETTKTQAEHEPSNGSHESWAQIRWILWADLDLEGSGEYTLIWQIIIWQISHSSQSFKSLSQLDSRISSSCWVVSFLGGCEIVCSHRMTWKPTVSISSFSDSGNSRHQPHVFHTTVCPPNGATRHHFMKIYRARELCGCLFSGTRNMKKTWKLRHVSTHINLSGTGVVFFFVGAVFKH